MFFLERKNQRTFIPKLFGGCTARRCQKADIGVKWGRLILSNVVRKSVALSASDRLWEHWHQVLLGLCPRFCRFRNLHRTSSTANFGKVGFWAVRNLTFSSRYGVSRLPCVKGAVSVVVFGRKLKKTSRKACFFYKGVENCLHILVLRYLFEAEPISGRSIGNVEILIDFGVFDNASRFKAQVLSFLYGNFSALYLKSTGLRSFCVKQYI